MENNQPFIAFAQLVKAMRKAQTDFFRSAPKTQAREEALQKSKELEFRVDDYSLTAGSIIEFEKYKMLVQQMRLYQRTYFKAEYGSREKGSALSKAKDLEKLVDRFQLPFDGKGNPITHQPSLF